MYLVTAYFDDSSSQDLTALVERTAEISGNDFMTANHIPPHLTLLQFHSKGDSLEIISAFEHAICSMTFDDVVFKKAQSEIPHVVYVPLVKNENLLAANKALSDSFSLLKETIINKHYAPGFFYPHVSLTKRLDDVQLKKTEDFLKEIEVPSSGKIARIVLTEGKPPRELKEIVLHQCNQ